MKNSLFGDKFDILSQKRLNVYGDQCTFRRFWLKTSEVVFSTFWYFKSYDFSFKLFMQHVSILFMFLLFSNFWLNFQLNLCSNNFWDCRKTSLWSGLKYLLKLPYIILDYSDTVEFLICETLCLGSSKILPYVWK